MAVSSLQTAVNGRQQRAKSRGQRAKNIGPEGNAAVCASTAIFCCVVSADPLCAMRSALFPMIDDKPHRSRCDSHLRSPSLSSPRESGTTRQCDPVHWRNQCAAASLSQFGFSKNQWHNAGHGRADPSRSGSAPGSVSSHCCSTLRSLHKWHEQRRDWRVLRRCRYCKSNRLCPSSTRQESPCSCPQRKATREFVFRRHTLEDQGP